MPLCLYEGRQRLQVNPGGDHQGCERVTAFVWRDPLQARLLPHRIGGPLQLPRRQRLAAVRAED
jgi:hypothetical protein